MVILEILIALAIWFATGHAIEKVYTKAGFVDAPKFVFWVPGLNLAFLVYLAFAEWPSYREN
ncbi:hypothetical protein [Endozoicomonas sp. ALB115]|uniref:hypothetical protein n=1 Tax=Endozoicomonas sp. ALB115 TaxID=3403074 RepID=UPI003BB77CBD